MFTFSSYNMSCAEMTSKVGVAHKISRALTRAVYLELGVGRLIDYVVNADNRFVTVIIDYHNRFSFDAIHYKRWNISR